MPFPIIIALNQTASPIPLADLGVEVPSSGQTTLSANLGRAEILEDPGLLVEVEAGNIVLEIDGTALSPLQASNYIAPPASSTPSLGNYTAVLDPTASADSSLGYDVGSRWINTVSASEFVCVNASVGAAVWVRVSGEGEFPGASTDDAVARFDGTSGAVLQNSVLTVSDAGSADLPGLYLISGVRANDAVTAYTSSAGQTFAAGPDTLNLDAVSVTSSLYTVAGGALTVGASGRYLVGYEATLRGTTSNRTQIQTWLERDTVEVGGTRGDLYLRNTNYGATAAASIVLDVVSGEGFRLRAQRTTGTTTASVVQNGTRLTVVRLT